MIVAVSGGLADPWTLVFGSAVTVSAALATMKLRVTVGAAPYDAFPAWSALTEQVPEPWIVIVDPLVPLAVQTAAGAAVNVTGLPDAPPVALTVNGASP